MDAFLVELIRLGDWNVPALYQSPIGVATTAGLGGPGSTRGRIRVLLRSQLMRFAVAVETQGGFLVPIGQRLAVDTSNVALHGLLVTGLTGGYPQLLGRRNPVSPVAALAWQLGPTLAPVHTLGKGAG